MPRKPGEKGTQITLRKIDKLLINMRSLTDGIKPVDYLHSLLSEGRNIMKAYKSEQRNEFLIESYKIKVEEDNNIIPEDLNHPHTTMRVLAEDFDTLKQLSGYTGKSMKEIISSLVIYEKEKFYENILGS